MHRSCLYSFVLRSHAAISNMLFALSSTEEHTDLAALLSAEERVTVWLLSDEMKSTQLFC